jgi:hypothetical protein
MTKFQIYRALLQLLPLAIQAQLLPYTEAKHTIDEKGCGPECYLKNFVCSNSTTISCITNAPSTTEDFSTHTSISGGGAATGSLVIVTDTVRVNLTDTATNTIFPTSIGISSHTTTSSSTSNIQPSITSTSDFSTSISSALLTSQDSTSGLVFGTTIIHSLSDSTTSLTVPSLPSNLPSVSRNPASSSGASVFAQHGKPSVLGMVFAVGMLLQRRFYWAKI